MPFIEALRQLQFQIGNENFITSLVTLLPTVSVVGEMKTKPSFFFFVALFFNLFSNNLKKIITAQQANKNLRSLGMVESYIFARAERGVDQETKKKIALFCNVKEENVCFACFRIFFCFFF